MIKSGTGIALFLSPTELNSVEGLRDTEVQGWGVEALRSQRVGLGKRNGEQHGLTDGWNSINSARIPSGS